jgi:hypothetical protein
MDSYKVKLDLSDENDSYIGANKSFNHSKIELEYFKNLNM